MSNWIPEPRLRRGKRRLLIEHCEAQGSLDERKLAYSLKHGF